MKNRAWISEIFSSVQGEGPLAGERHLFVRFCGCHRSCAFCDTPTQRTEQAELTLRDGTRRSLQNPFTPHQLFEALVQLDEDRIHTMISITGGAPLLQIKFMEELLPLLKGSGRKIYLETTGDLPEALDRVIAELDWISMDIKLPSVTLEAPQWQAHLNFLTRCVNRSDVRFFIKVVVSAHTEEDDLRILGEQVRQTAPRALLVLQPLTPSEKMKAVPTPEQLLAWQEMLLRMGVAEVRVIPQMHIQLNML